MGQASVERASREVVSGLDGYIDLLKKKLADARRARALLQGEAPGESIPAGALDQVFIGETGTTDSGSGSNEQLERALLASVKGRRPSVTLMLRIVAEANAGIVVLSQASSVLLRLGLSKSTPAHLPGYLITQMKKSKEFVREPGRGRGVYRWLNYVGDVEGEAPAVAPVLSEDDEDNAF